MTWKIVIAYSTFKNKEDALTFSKIALEQNLIACANISENMTSLYKWEGAIHEDTECSVLFKMPCEKLDLFMTFLKEQHPYTTPCFLYEKISTTEEFYNFCR
jgi:periplasmic divalent cation tolerance protein